MARLVVLLALLVALAGCGGKQEQPRAQTTTGHVTARVYMLRDARVAAVTRRLPPPAATPRAALERLLEGPTPRERRAGLSTAVPAGNRIDSFRVADGMAHVDLALDLSRRGVAQVVYTLTQFPEIRRAAVATPDAAPGPLTRAALEDLTPLILVEEPTPYAEVTSPLRVWGSSNTFEATLQLELRRDDGSVLARTTVTATSGTGTRGTFESSLDFDATPGRAILEAYEQSAKDGSRIHVVEIPLVISG
jgi:hypothetical protein